MALQPRIAQVTLGIVGGTRQFQMTAAVQDTAAGGSVVVSYAVDTTTGLTPPVLPDFIHLDFYIEDTSTVVRRIVITAPLSGSIPFHFTADGTAGSAARAGMLRLRIRAVKNTGASGSQYDVQSDNATGEILPTGGSISSRDQGYVRSTTTIASLAVSNVAVGGAAPSVFAYTTAGGDQFFVRAVLGAAAYRQSTVPQYVGGSGRVSLSGLVGSSSVNLDTFGTPENAADNRFPAARTDQPVTVGTPSNTWAGIPWTVFTSVPTFTVPVDPRLTRTPLFQVDDDTFGTPPASKHKADHRRLVSQQGFLGSRTTNARGEGVNGVTYNVELRAAKPGGLVQTTGLVTATRGGQAGWSPTLLAWNSVLPSGSWTKGFTVTAPSDVAGADYTVQAPGESTSYFLVAPDPDLNCIVNAAHDLGLGGRHFSAGMAIVVTGYLLNRRTGKKIPASSFESVSCALVRGAGSPMETGGTGVSYEFLDAAGVWQPWPLDVGRATLPMTVSAADAGVVERRIVSDDTWGVRDVRTAVLIQYEGTLYSADLVTANVSPENRHDKVEVDWLGFPG